MKKELPIKKRYKSERYKGRTIQFKEYVNTIGLKRPVIAYWSDEEPVFNRYGASKHFDGFKNVDIHRGGKTKAESLLLAKKEIDKLANWDDKKR